MNCNDSHTCALTPILADMRNNADENHEAAALTEWMELHEAFLSEDDSFDAQDGDLHFIR